MNTPMVTENASLALSLRLKLYVEGSELPAIRHSNACVNAPVPLLSSVFHALPSLVTSVCEAASQHTMAKRKSPSATPDGLLIVTLVFAASVVVEEDR